MKPSPVNASRPPIPIAHVKAGFRRIQIYKSSGAMKLLSPTPGCCEPAGAPDGEAVDGNARTCLMRSTNRGNAGSSTMLCTVSKYGPAFVAIATILSIIPRAFAIRLLMSA